MIFLQGAIFQFGLFSIFYALFCVVVSIIWIRPWNDSQNKLWFIFLKRFYCIHCATRCKNNETLMCPFFTNSFSLRQKARGIKPKKWLAYKDKPIEKLLKCIDAFHHTRGKTLSNKFEMRKKKIRTRVSRAWLGSNASSSKTHFWLDHG